MQLECLGSSSSGNCYLLRANNETLIIECGVNVRDIKKALGWKMCNVVGCLVSHEHQDHAGYINELKRCGIRVMALKEVFDAYGINNRVFATELQPMRKYKAGEFTITTIPVAHDVPCLGFVIEHEEMGKTLFVTDTMLIKQQIKGLNHIMIEANYADDILQENIDMGRENPSMRKRLLNSHMEIGTTAEYIRKCDLSAVNDIVLLHLSHRNADLTRFATEIIKISGLPVIVARKGVKMDFSKDIC